MPTYATATDVTDILTLANPDLEPVTSSEIKQAELDIDDVIGLQTWNNDTERKLTPNNLFPYQRVYLKRAVASQVEYRRVMGPDFFARAQFKHVETPDGFKRDGVLPYVSPKATQLLAEAGLSRRIGRITSRSQLPYNWFETAADEEG